jgi:hypothetical protein
VPSRVRIARWQLRGAPLADPGIERSMDAIATTFATGGAIER